MMSIAGVSNDDIANLVPKVHSFTEIAKILNINMSRRNKLGQIVKWLGLDTSHFTGYKHAAGKPSCRRLKPEEVFVVIETGERKNTSTLRRCMLENGFNYECSICKNNGQWENKNLILEIDHISGNWRDNRKENLRFLCPNCHSQTPTHKALKYKQEGFREICPICKEKKDYYAQKCKKCDINDRTNRPTKEILSELCLTMTNTQIGIQYGVCNGTIKRWKQHYGIKNKKPQATNRESCPICNGTKTRTSKHCIKCYNDINKQKIRDSKTGRFTN